MANYGVKQRLLIEVTRDLYELKGKIMSKEFSKIERYLVVSNVGTRDGIGVEIYSGEGMILEIFRDDTKRKTK